MNFRQPDAAQAAPVEPEDIGILPRHALHVDAEVPAEAQPQREGPFRKGKAEAYDTSSREEPYEATLIERFGLKAIIGKGGMGPKTAEACKKFGCVYLHAVGGAAQILAATVVNIPNVYYYDQFGAPEAIWQFEVKDFPAVVTMDTNGNSRHADVKQHSQSVLETLFN